MRWCNGERQSSPGTTLMNWLTCSWNVAQAGPARRPQSMKDGVSFESTRSTWRKVSGRGGCYCSTPNCSLLSPWSTSCAEGPAADGTHPGHLVDRVESCCEHERSLTVDDGRHEMRGTTTPPWSVRRSATWSATVVAPPTPGVPRAFVIVARRSIPPDGIFAHSVGHVVEDGMKRLHGCTPGRTRRLPLAPVPASMPPGFDEHGSRQQRASRGTGPCVRSSRWCSHDDEPYAPVTVLVEETTSGWHLRSSEPPSCSRTSGSRSLFGDVTSAMRA